MTFYESDKIPGPPPSILLGNIPDLLPDFIGNFRRLHNEYGPVMRIRYGGHDYVSVCDPEALQTVCKDGEYFTKEVVSTYEELAILNGRGLVTTATKDPDWVLAHKLLMPAFSAKAMRAYHYKMGKCIQELIGIIEAHQKSGEELDVSRWMIALALESIGRIGFDYNFDLLKDSNAERHPFTVALSYVQSMMMKRSQSVSWMKWVHTSANSRFQRDLETLRGTIDDVLKERRANPHGSDDSSDLLDFMLQASTKSGERLDDRLIRDNIITFLNAGHNTTSSFLSWTILELCRHPEIVKKILQEIVDAGITPDEIPSPEQVGKCTYLDLVIQESLRYHSPIPLVYKVCKKDCTIKAQGNEYHIKAGQVIQVQISSVHKESTVWDNPNVFDPDRFSDPEANQKRPLDAWMPFSDGPRACIGRQFSLQEGKLALIMLLTRFRFVMDNPEKQIDYEIVVSIKPVDLFVKVLPAELPPPTDPNNAEATAKKVEKSREQSVDMPSGQAKFPLPKVTFLYGTQTNTAEEYARKLSSQAKNFGFKEIVVDELDSWSLAQGGDLARLDRGEKAPTSEDGVKMTELVVIVTATYNGHPPDNAIEFDKWLSSKTEDNNGKANILEGLLYAVFGCGNRQWASTFQAYPKKVDIGLELLGAERLLPAGVGDANEDIDGDFSEWSANFWSALMQRYGQATSDKAADIMTKSGPIADPCDDFTLQFLPLHKDTSIVEAAKENKNRHGPLVTIKANRELQNSEASARSTRHIECEFPAEENKLPLYEAGDHLEVYPINDTQLVEEIAINLGFALDSVFEVKKLNITNLSPRSLAATIKGPCTIRNALTYYADLTGPPTRYTLAVLGKQLAKVRPDVAERLLDVLQPGKETPRLKEFLATHRTIVDVIKAFEITELSFKEFLSSVNAIVPRKYSISSGPSEHPNQPSITVGVVRDLGGPDGKRVYHGLSSGYLQQLEPGTKIHAQIKPCKSTFRLPSDETLPVIFICAGTGFSPFRGFLQERRAKGLKSTEKNGTSDAYLFFGCRNPEHDFIYEDEIKSYLEDGTLTSVFTAFSRTGQTVRYVQHCILQEAALIFELLENRNASVYICGSAGTMARDVRRVFIRLKEQMTGLSESEAVEYIDNLIEQGRYNEDIWG
ncbi:uncharacterized protein VTP21DRAFT_2272 [Calcarisporiella thermophila]|uniref:uncharacterized protein n=1 Tax=Calcarisporiella thermophila TaxID=911321 RepID=UPI003742A789